MVSEWHARCEPPFVCVTSEFLYIKKLVWISEIWRMGKTLEEIGVPLKRGGVCYRQNQYQGAGDVDQLVEYLLA